MTAATTSARTMIERKPKRRSIGVVSGLIARLPANSARSTAPDLTAVHPNPTWKRSGSRNGTALIMQRNRDPLACDTRNVEPEDREVEERIGVGEEVADGGDARQHRGGARGDHDRPADGR